MTNSWKMFAGIAVVAAGFALTTADEGFARNDDAGASGVQAQVATATVSGDEDAAPVAGAMKDGAAKGADDKNAAQDDDKTREKRKQAASSAEPTAATGARLYDAAWLRQQPAGAGNAEQQCLTEAIYFEARGESLRGQFAVAEVILNRRDNGAYPGTVCAVVHQRGAGSCQFSYVCTGKRSMSDAASKARAERIARLMLDGAPRQLTAGATHFHTTGVNPSWARAFPRTAAIGAHLFYREDRRTRG